MGMKQHHLIIIQLAVSALVAGNPAGQQQRAECPSDYGDVHPVLIVSLDGFRADYLTRGLSPTLNSLAETGVTAPYMKASYPTLTFPNHYSIATGSYPEHHGIIANKFYDPDFHATFSLGSEESLKGRWWGAEPIWNTVTTQGKLSATYFWPGSDADIGGTHPTYWFNYTDDTPYEERVDQVMAWILLPEEARPSWISLYFPEPDHTGHENGPDSTEEDERVAYVDLMIKRLVDGLTSTGMTSCVNLIIIADHGMAASGADHIIKMVDYIPDIYDTAYTFTGAFGRIDPKNESQEVKLGMMEKLSCQRSDLRVFEKEGLPTRFHFSNNRRIEDIVLDMDPGFTAAVSSDWYLNGQHGYDNYFTVMNALFLATGPAFKSGIQVEPFQNIELYNLMCLLAGVEPSPNNGTEGSLYHLLINPPEYPVLPREDPPPTSSFPEGDLQDLLSLSGCDGDLKAPEEWLQTLNFSSSEEDALMAYHLPWGFPHSGDLPASLTLLHHDDHVTAYSEALRMPLWTSFTLTDVMPGSAFASWCSDVRLTQETTITCADYEHLVPDNVTMYPLFPPSMSKIESLERIPYMVSNAIPMTNQMQDQWQWLMEELISSWITSQGTLNLVMGPLFDNDANSYVDNFTDFSSIPELSSDMFVVVTRCEEYVTSIDLCPAVSLDAAAFIYPQYQPVSNCLDRYQYALEFSAKVRDIELATGLTFYPDLSTKDRTAITLRINSNLWPID